MKWGFRYSKSRLRDVMVVDIQILSLPLSLVVLICWFRHCLVENWLLVSISQVRERLSSFVFKGYACLRLIVIVSILFWERLRFIDVRSSFVRQVLFRYSLLTLSLALFAIVNAALLQKSCRFISCWALTPSWFGDARAIRAVDHLCFVLGFWIYLLRVCCNRRYKRLGHGSSVGLSLDVDHLSFWLGLAKSIKRNYWDKCRKVVPQLLKSSLDVKNLVLNVCFSLCCEFFFLLTKGMSLVSRRIGTLLSLSCFWDLIQVQRFPSKLRELVTLALKSFWTN